MADQQRGANKGATLDRSRTTTTWQVKAEALVADEFDLDIRLVERRSSRGLSGPVGLIAPGTGLRVMQNADPETELYTCKGYTCVTCPQTVCDGTCETCKTCVTCETCITCDTCATQCDTCPQTNCFTCDCPS